MLVVLLGSGWLQLSLGQSTALKVSDIRTHLQKGVSALQTNDPGTAATEFQTVLKLDPKNIEAHLGLGVIEMSQGNCQAASQDFRGALAVQPSLAKAQALLGICGVRLGDSAARGLLESSFAKLADLKLRTQVGIELVGLHYDRGDLERAVSVVQKLINLNPEDANILYMAQRLYGELADDTLNKLAIVAPDSARMQQVIAERLINEGDADGAIVHYRKALEIQPRLPGIHFELAEAILESDRMNPQSQDASKRELEAALQAEGDSARVECLFAKLALLQDDLDQANARYSQALKLNPSDVHSELGMAHILMAKGNPEEAVKYLHLAIASDPLNTQAHYQLATAYRKLQRPEESQKEFKLFKEIKQTKERVEDLYREMKKPTKPEQDDVPEDNVGPR